MLRGLTMLRMMAFLLALVGAAHAYVWGRLARDTALPAPWPACLAVAFAAMALGLPAGRLLAHAGLGPRARRCLRLPLWWNAVFFIALWCTATADLVRGALNVALPLLGGAAPDPLLAHRAAAAAVLVATFTLAALAVRSARAGPRTVRVPVALDRLPAALDGTTILQISDLHIADFIGRPYVERMVAQANALSPDVVVLTGDIVDGPLGRLRDAAAPLAGLRARHGVYLVTGNHEYYHDVGAWTAAFEALGIRVLRNARVPIGTAAQSFDLAGVDDLFGATFGHGHGCDLGAATAGRDPSRELVLLAHQPRVAAAAAHYGVGLMLSGHTHGGQIWPFGLLVRLQQPAVAGLFRRQATQIYVSRGTGYYGAPLRLGAPAEVTLLTLHAAAAA